MPVLRFTCITLEYPPDKGGVASYLAGLFGVLPSAVEVVRAKTRRYWPQWWPMIRQCRASGADALIVSHVLPVGTAAWIARCLGGPAYVVIVHGLDLLLAYRTRWKSWLVRRVLRDAYLVVSNSGYTDGVCKKLFQRSTTVLTPGHTGRELISRARARSALGLSDDEKVVLSVGRLVPRKGFDVLTEACHGLNARLVMLHGATDEERDLWYAAADVFALLAREEKDDVEGFGIVCLEAAAAGLPVVAGRSGGVPEAIEDGVTGVLVDPRSAAEARRVIQDLLDHPDKARQMGRAGQTRVHQKFAWEDRARTLVAHLPLVSVIIPVFDRPAAFRRCLIALAQQTYRHLEVIVVDDGSREDMRAVVDTETRLDVRYLRQENHGAAHARNRGFEASTGELVLFLDADAVLVPTALEEMTRVLVKDPAAQVVYSDYAFGWKRFYGRPFEREALEQQNFIHTTAMMRRRVFSGFDESLKRFQDWDLWLTLVTHGAKFCWLPKKLFRLERGGTMSHWLPSFMHQLPWEWLGWMPKRLRQYREAEWIVREKHGMADKSKIKNQKSNMDAMGWWIASIFTLEITSALTIFYPRAHSLALVVAVIVMFVLAWKRPALAASLLLVEYVIGSKGALLRFGGDGLGHGGVPLRIAWFVAFMIGWLAWSLAHKAYRAWPTYLQGRFVYVALAAVLVYAFVAGLVRSNPFLLADANGWGAWLLLLPALDLAHHAREELRRYMPSALFVALGWLIFKTLVLFYIFAHVTDPTWLDAVYLWVRRTGVGEITRVLPNVNVWRVFLQSHVYLLPLVIGAFWYGATRPRLARVTWLLGVGAWATLLVSLSRSLILGVASGLVMAAGWVLFGRANGRDVRQLADRPYVGMTRMIVMLFTACILVVGLFYAPPRPLGSLGDAFLARTNLDEEAAVSRWKLWPVLWEGVKHHPVIGSGFGATLTYESRDPRVVQATGGLYTTYAFEWGWLDHWFKFGVFGIPVMLWIVFRLGQRAWLSRHDFWIRATLVTSLLALTVTHIFTPYLNHPLGIVWLVGLEGWLADTPHER